MTPNEFVAEFVELKTSLIKLWLSGDNASAVGSTIASMDLRNDQRDALRSVIDQAMTDALYTVLLGLDGAATIGHCQEAYQLFDEHGNALTGNGIIEAEAWEAFHGVA